LKGWEKTKKKLARQDCIPSFKRLSTELDALRKERLTVHQADKMVARGDVNHTQQAPCERWPPSV